MEKTNIKYVDIDFINDEAFVGYEKSYKLNLCTNTMSYTMEHKHIKLCE